MFGRAEVIDSSLVHCRFSGACAHGHPTYRVYGRFWRNPEGAITILRRTGALSLMPPMSVAHDMRATTEAHHQEKEARNHDEIQKRSRSVRLLRSGSCQLLNRVLGACFRHLGEKRDIGVFLR
jgi:hypothetical protein